MKKTVLMVFLTTSMTFAYMAEVKKTDINITINSKEKSLKKDAKLELKAGDIVCYKSGDGRLVIKGENYKKQITKKSSPCRKLPTTKDEAKDIKVMAMISSVFRKSKEESVNGASRAETQIKELKKEIKLDENKKYILVENKDWGPLPVSLTIVDKDDKAIGSFENTEDDVTSFLIPTSNLKSGYTFKVTNNFDDSLAVIEIK